MMTKKKLKTKFDYEVRTFCICALLLFAFTMLFVNPAINNTNSDNETIKTEIQEEETTNSRLMYEQEEILSEGTVEKN